MTQMVMEVHDQIARLDRMISQLLTLARADEDALIRSAADRIALVTKSKQVLVLRAGSAAARNVELQLEAGQEEMHVDANELLFDEVLGNVIDNAIRYGTAGGLVVTRLFRDYAENWDDHFKQYGDDFFTQEFWYLFVGIVEAYWRKDPMNLATAKSEMRGLKNADDKTKNSRIKAAEERIVAAPVKIVDGNIKASKRESGEAAKVVRAVTGVSWRDIEASKSAVPGAHLLALAAGRGRLRGRRRRGANQDPPQVR